MDKGVILLGHGSRSQAANIGLLTLADMVQAGLGARVLPAFFQFGKPTLQEVVARLVDEGYKDIIIVPAFLFPGMHLQNDVPEVISQLEAQYQGKIYLVQTPSLGPDQRLAEILVERVRQVADSDGNGADVDAIKEILNPAEITARSRVLIDEALGNEFFPRHFPGADGEVVRRVVHAMGNPDVAYLLRFHPQAVAAGLAALKNGATIFTDVRMVQVGINAAALEQFGAKTVCLIHDPGVRALALEQGVTRAMTAVRYFKESLPGNIVVVGNAPTALTEVVRQAAAGYRPALIVGTAVGFVGAAEAKEQLVRQEIPYITLLGNQGGSTASVAIINALLALAKGQAGL